MFSNKRFGKKVYKIWCEIYDQNKHLCETLKELLLLKERKAEHIDLVHAFVVFHRKVLDLQAHKAQIA